MGKAYQKSLTDVGMISGKGPFSQNGVFALTSFFILRHLQIRIYVEKVPGAFSTDLSG